MAYNKNYVLLKYSSPSYTVVKSHDTHMELQPYIYLWFPIQMKNDNIVSVGHMELQVVLLLPSSIPLIIRTESTKGNASVHFSYSFANQP